jgi:hypothetical protein
MWVMTSLKGREQIQRNFHPACKAGTNRTPPLPNSIPRIPFIQWLAVLIAKPAIFGLKIFLLVVFSLVADVFPQGLDVRRTDAELAVTALPGKVEIPWIEGFDPT